MPVNKSYVITISGRVQNVGFRYHTFEKATELNIFGFVANQANGNVYIEAEGLEQKVNEFINWCHQGPGWAHVVEVKFGEQPLRGFTKFEIKR